MKSLFQQTILITIVFLNLALVAGVMGIIAYILGGI